MVWIHNMIRGTGLAKLELCLVISKQLIVHNFFPVNSLNKVQPPWFSKVMTIQLSCLHNWKSTAWMDMGSESSSSIWVRYNWYFALTDHAPSFHSLTSMGLVLLDSTGHSSICNFFSTPQSEHSGLPDGIPVSLSILLSSWSSSGLKDAGGGEGMRDWTFRVSKEVT